MSPRPVLIQTPPGAEPGLPLKIDFIDGKGGSFHADKPHSHGFFSLMYVTRGEGVMAFGRRKVPVGPGSVSMTAPGEVHDTRGIPGVERWALSFTPDAFGTDGATWLFPVTGQPEWLSLLRRSKEEAKELLVPLADQAAWLTRMQRLHEEMTGRRRGYREISLAYLKIILITAARLVSPPDAPETRSPLVDEVFHIIEKRFAASQLSLAQVAREAGRSPAHLTTVMREHTGLTVQQWIIERRLAEARQRLLGTDEDVLIVAERSGYRDPSLFSRHFKRAHGVSPGEWRSGSSWTEK